MVSTTQPPTVTSTDRFGLTLFFAIIVHAVIILGVTFSTTDKHNEPTTHPPLEITLVHQRSDETPDDAEYLAQANLEGGGNVDEKIRTTSPSSSPAPPKETGMDDITSPAMAPPEQLKPDTSFVLTQDTSSYQINSEDNQTNPNTATITAAELVQRSMEIASLSAEIDRSRQAYAQRKKHRYISARSREFRDAAYLDAWRAKIERIGNLNYPEEAKRQGLSGNLILDVGLNQDGSVHNITLRHSSGQKILDDAAIRIVKLAAPFAPFTKELRKDTDVLHIIRTWQFLDDDQLQTH